MVVKNECWSVGGGERRSRKGEKVLCRAERIRERESESCWSKAGGGQQRQIGMAAWAVRQPRQAECVSREGHVGSQARPVWV